MGKLTHGASAHRSCTIRNRGAVPVAICILPEVDKEPARWLSFTGAHATIEPGGVHTVGISATIDSYDASQLVKCGGLMEANLRIFCLTAVQNQTPDLPRSSSKLSLKVHGRYNCASLFGRPLQSLAVMAWVRSPLCHHSSLPCPSVSGRWGAPPRVLSVLACALPAAQWPDRRASAEGG